MLGELLRPRMAEIVEADPGVRIEIAQRLVLAIEQHEQPRQQRMLEHVGKVAGVEEMAVGEHRNGQA